MTKFQATGNIRINKNKPTNRYCKTVQLDKPTYRKLKLYSFMNNVPMAKVAVNAVNQYLKK